MQRKIFGAFRPSVLITLGILWSVGVGIGLYILLDYEMTPGQGGEAPESQQRRVASRAIL